MPIPYAASVPHARLDASLHLYRVYIQSRLVMALWAMNADDEPSELYWPCTVAAQRMAETMRHHAQTQTPHAPASFVEMHRRSQQLHLLHLLHRLHAAFASTILQSTLQALRSFLLPPVAVAVVPPCWRPLAQLTPAVPPARQRHGPNLDARAHTAFHERRASMSVCAFSLSAAAQLPVKFALQQTPSPPCRLRSTASALA